MKMGTGDKNLEALIKENSDKADKAVWDDCLFHLLAQVFKEGDGQKEYWSLPRNKNQKTE